MSYSLHIAHPNDAYEGKWRQIESFDHPSMINDYMPALDFPDGTLIRLRNVHIDFNLWICRDGSTINIDNDFIEKYRSTLSHEWIAELAWKRSTSPQVATYMLACLKLIHHDDKVRWRYIVAAIEKFSRQEIDRVELLGYRRDIYDHVAMSQTHQYAAICVSSVMNEIQSGQSYRSRFFTNLHYILISYDPTGDSFPYKKERAGKAICDTLRSVVPFHRVIEGVL